VFLLSSDRIGHRLTLAWKALYRYKEVPVRLPRVTLPALAVVPLAASLIGVAPGAALADEPEPDEPEVILEEDFSGPGIPDGWNPVEGEWEVIDGRLVGTSESSSQQSRITFGSHERNYRVEVTVRFEQVVNAARWAAVAACSRCTPACCWRPGSCSSWCRRASFRYRTRCT
jgi:hypothetical protein